MVVEALKWGEPGKKLKKADFGTIRKQIFGRITYPKSSRILLGETFLHPISFFGVWHFLSPPNVLSVKMFCKKCIVKFFYQEIKFK